MGSDVPAVWVHVIEYFCYVAAAALVLTGVWLSWRQRRLHPVLLLCIATLSLFWIESPYDWATFASFSPDMARITDFGPWPHTWGGLPAFAPAGYVMYFSLPTLATVAVARRAWFGKNWSLPTRLLVTGVLAGIIWSMFFDHLATHSGFYRFAWSISGLTLWPGTIHQTPLTINVAMGIQVAVLAYAVGRRDNQGRTVVESWSSRHTSTPAAATALSIVVIVVVAHIAYLAVMAPYAAVNALDLANLPAGAQIFPGIPNQPK